MFRFYLSLLDIFMLEMYCLDLPWEIDPWTLVMLVGSANSLQFSCLLK
jgi:hypothetical protein